MWTSRTIALEDERSLHVAQTGEGPDVVFVHGAITTHHDWLAPAEALARDHRVTVVDRPGHGLSRRPRFSGTPRDQAGQIAAGLKALDISSSTFVGHSFGGLVVLALAEQRPRAVEALILVAPIAFPEPRLLEQALFVPRAAPILGPLLSRMASGTRLERVMLEQVQRQMFAPAEVPTAWKERFPYDQVLDPDVLVAEGEDAAAVLPLAPAGLIDLTRIEAPVHILIGTGDRVVRHDRQGRHLARLLRGAELTEIEGAGHMLHHSHTEALANALAAIPLPA